MRQVILANFTPGQRNLLFEVKTTESDREQPATYNQHRREWSLIYVCLAGWPRSARCIFQRIQISKKPHANHRAARGRLFQMNRQSDECARRITINLQIQRKQLKAYSRLIGHFCLLPRFSRHRKIRRNLMHPSFFLICATTPSSHVQVPILKWGMMQNFSGNAVPWKHENTNKLTDRRERNEKTKKLKPKTLAPVARDFV